MEWELVKCLDCNSISYKMLKSVSQIILTVMQALYLAMKRLKLQGRSDYEISAKYSDNPRLSM
jgi:hypothetical protein